MSRQEFQKRVFKANWYDKYWYFFVYSLFSLLYCYLLYDAITNQAKYDKYGTRYLVYISSTILICLGIRGLFLVPNRYKVLSVASQFRDGEKKEIVQALIGQLGVSDYKRNDTFYRFIYKKSWLASSYNAFISFDSENFYVSVQGQTGGYVGGGIIDFGGTEKLRQKIITCLTNIIDEK